MIKTVLLIDLFFDFLSLDVRVEIIAGSIHHDEFCINNSP